MVVNVDLYRSIGIEEFSFWEVNNLDTVLKQNMFAIHCLQKPTS